MTKDDFENQLAWLQANLDAEREVRAAAEAERNKAVEVIREICQAFIPDELDEILRENKTAIERWNPLDYRHFILTKGMARMHRLELLSSGHPADELTRTQAEIEQLREELAAAQDLRDQLARAQALCAEAQAQIAARDEELARLRTEVTQLRAERSAERSRRSLTRARESTAEVFGTGAACCAPTLHSPESSTPEWFAQWQASEEFERDSALIRVMGYQGFCLRKSVETALVKAGVITLGSGAVQRLFTRVKERGLVEESEPQTETGMGRSPFLLRLTERGREAFRLLFGQEAVESEYDRLLARHKSDEHVLLNIQTRDALLEYGAEVVDLYPQPVSPPTGGLFDVDLVAVFPDQPPLYVEAERGGAKNRSQRDQKWANYRLVTGDFYIVVPNKKVQAQIITEITTWAYQTRNRLTLHVCNLSLLGKEGVPLWQFEREMGSQ